MNFDRQVIRTARTVLDDGESRTSFLREAGLIWKLRCYYSDRLSDAIAIFEGQ